MRLCTYCGLRAPLCADCALIVRHSASHYSRDRIAVVKNNTTCLAVQTVLG